MSFIDLDYYKVEYPWGGGVSSVFASWGSFEDSLKKAILEARRREVDPLSLYVRYEDTEGEDVFWGTLGEYLEDAEELLEEFLE